MSKSNSPAYTLNDTRASFRNSDILRWYDKAFCKFLCVIYVIRLKANDVKNLSNKQVVQ